MVGKNVYMVYSKNGHAGVATQDNNAVLDFADTSWEHHYALAGLDNSSYVHTRPSVPHLMVQTDVPYGLYYTFPYRTAYGYDTDRIFGENTNQWGIWHEFGHMQQQTPVDWDGLGEVTVNIFSLSAERAFEVTPNRITADNYWPDAKAFIQQTGAKNFNDNNVWIKLIMFHQLWLAYGDSFYTTLQRAVREDGGSYPDSHAKLKNFMLKACQISGHNLTEFFKKWGIQDTSGDIYPALAALGLPKPIVNPAYYTDTEKPLLENGATYQIVTALNNSSVVNVSSSNPVNGTAVNLWSNTGNATQKFLARKLSDGSYALKSLADTSKVLAVKGASGTAGALIHTYTFDNGVAQRWTPELSGGGYYLLKSSVASNRYMDIQSSGTANGTAILTWGKTSNNNQKFRFVKQ